MLEEAIKLIKKQREMYILQNRSIQSYRGLKQTRENLRKEIQLRDYIIQILQEHLERLE